MLLRSTNYNSPIDTWACGGMLAELFTLRPTFPGTSEADQIYKICSVLGSPTMRTWSEGIRLAAQMSFKFPQFVSSPIAQIVPNASPEALSLIADLLKYVRNSSFLSFVSRSFSRQKRKLTTNKILHLNTIFLDMIHRCAQLQRRLFNIRSFRQSIKITLCVYA